MASIALTFSSKAPDEVLQVVTQLVAGQVDGATLVPVRPDPARQSVLLAHLPERTLQQALEGVYEHPLHAPKNDSSNTTARRPQSNSNTAADAVSGTVAFQPGALQAGSCSRLNVTPAEAVLLAISCLERVKVRCRAAPGALPLPSMLLLRWVYLQWCEHQAGPLCC